MPPFNASRHGDSDNMCFKFIRSLDGEILQFKSQFLELSGYFWQVSVYQVFASHNLPTIKSIGGWAEWKKLSITEWAFEHLDDQIDSQDFNENSKTYMEAIMEKTFPNGSPSN